VQLSLETIARENSRSDQASCLSDAG
jgi:hypothetical protein